MDRIAGHGLAKPGSRLRWFPRLDQYFREIVEHGSRCIPARGRPAQQGFGPWPVAALQQGRKIA